MLPIAARAETVTLGALEDNTLYESATGALSNGAGSHFFAGRTGSRNGGRIRRGLVAFDPAGAIPAGATVTSVRLTLRMSRTISGAQTIRLHRVLADWGEGTSRAAGEEGGGAPSTPNDATWVHRFFNTAPWSSRGGDFAPTSSGTLSVGSTVGTYTWSAPGLVADVQAWVNGTLPNFGWILVGNESVLGTAKRFDSSEHATVAFRPQLVIDYMGTAVESTAWSTIKSLFR